MAQGTAAQIADNLSPERPSSAMGAATSHGTESMHGQQQDFQRQVPLWPMAQAVDHSTRCCGGLHVGW